MLRMSLHETSGLASGKYRLELHRGHRYSYNQLLRYCESTSCVSRTDVIAVLQCIVDFIVDAAREGHECDLGPLGRTRLAIRGSFEERPERIEDADFEYNLYWIVHSELKKKVRNLAYVLKRQLVLPISKVPSVTEVTACHPTSQEWVSNAWRAGDMLLISGRYLKFNPLCLDEGVFLQRKRRKEWMRVDQYRGIGPRRISCMIPYDWEGAGDLRIDVRRRVHPKDESPKHMGFYITLKELKPTPHQ